MATKKKTFNLSDRAMLTGLRFHRWHPHCVDQKATDEIADLNHADRDAGKYYKALVPKHALKGVRSAENLIRAEHIVMTLPWADDGYRILSQLAYSMYVERINKAKAAYAEQVAEFVEKYPEYRADAKKRLNGMFDPADYPSDAAIKGMFHADVHIRNIPSGTDFRLDLDDSASIRQAIEAEVQSTYEQGIREVWQNLHASITKAVERLKAYGVAAKDSEERKGFRASLITNIQEQVDLIPFLNIMDDPNLNKFADLIGKEITKYDSDQLKENDTIRDKVIASADDILSKMSAYIA